MKNYGVGFADGLKKKCGLPHQPAGWFAMTRETWTPGNARRYGAYEGAAGR